MAHWMKRLAFCRERGVGRTKIDELIGLGVVRAKKEGTSKNAPVLIDDSSYDDYVESLPDARGSQNPKRKTLARRITRADATT
jgi:hypothetical protein